MSIHMLVEKNPFAEIGINKVCVACGDRIQNQNNSTSDYLLLGEPPIKFFDALKLLTNFSELEQEQCPQYVCDECFNKANMILHFQKVCNNSANLIKEYIADKNYQETLKEYDTNEVSNKELSSATDNESDYESEEKKASRKEEKTVHLCPICGKSYNAKKHLIRHMHTHEDGRFICDVCNKRFHQKVELQNHYVTHTGEKPFLCDECPKRFGTKKHLKQHQVSHSAKKSFHCQNCGVGFRHKATLQSHLLKTCEVANVLTF